jgi:hypothetical protein
MGRWLVRFKTLALVAMLFMWVSSLWGQDASAVNVQTSCGHWAKLKLDKHKQFKGESDDLYQTGLCVGYFDGLMDGMDGTGGWISDGTTNYFHIKRTAINSTWDVIRSFYDHVDANPLEKGKPAWTVLQKVLTANGLATLSPETTQTRPSVLTQECKTGAQNVVNQFDSDTDLTAIDTPTLLSVYGKIANCMQTKGVTNEDSLLLFAAEAEASTALFSRAIFVLNKHELVPEFNVQRPPSAHTASRVATEQ